MTREQELEYAIKLVKESATDAARLASKTNRRKVWWSIGQATVQMSQCCVAFYRLEYGWGIFFALFAMSITTWTWKIFERSVNGYRKLKREGPELVKRLENALKEHRGY